MLALSDATGFVGASLGGLAHAARISREECEAALGYLLSPDEDSRSPEFEGRRIGIVAGGYSILNYTKYRELGRSIDRNEYLAEKQRESRERKRSSTKKDTSTDVNQRQPESTIGQHIASASASVSASEGEWREGVIKDPAYAHINVAVEFGKCQRWCEVNKKQLTRRRFINWLNRIEAPLTGFKGARSVNPPKVPEPLGPEISEEERLANVAKIRSITEGLTNKMASE